MKRKFGLRTEVVLNLNGPDFVNKLGVKVWLRKEDQVRGLRKMKRGLENSCRVFNRLST